MEPLNEEQIVNKVLDEMAHRFSTCFGKENGSIERWFEFSREGIKDKVLNNIRNERNKERTRASF